MSDTTRSLYQILQEYSTKQLSVIPNVNHQYSENIPITDEQKYYRMLFDIYYPRCSKIVPYFWMPKYVDANDASARTLSIYTDKVTDKVTDKDTDDKIEGKQCNDDSAIF